jgi:Methyltransferase domain
MSNNNLSIMVKKLYQQNRFPVLQNRVYSTEQEARNCVLGDIDIVQNLETGLIFNAAFNQDLMVYDENYNNEQGVSEVFKEHLNWVAQVIDVNLGRENLIEVGCGKGFFLELMLKKGFDITGFDSTYDGENPKIVKRYFEPGIIKKPANGLILRHVLEHIPDPMDFLFQLKKSNGDQGLIYIEVPCFDWIMESRTWFDLFYEHVNYFRLHDFKRMFGRIIECGHCFGRQYLYVIADLSTLHLPKSDETCLINFPENFLMSLNLPQEIQLREDGGRHEIAVWGGASKGVIYSLLRERIGLPIDLIIDVNPAKQGKYIPVTGLKVYSPDQAMMKLKDGATVYVMNSNYLTEIKEMSNHRFNYVGVDK